MASHTGRDILVPATGASIATQGTILVSLPLITSTTPTYSTIVAMPGITPNHSLAFFNMGLVSGATANNSGSTARILFSAQPQEGQVTLTYVNNAATVNASDIVYTFIATTR